MLSFLNDETGLVRWLCFELKDKICFSYSKEMVFKNVLIQTYHIAYNHPNFNPELTLNDILENEERNKKYTKLTTEEELVSKYFEKSNSPHSFIE